MARLSFYKSIVALPKKNFLAQIFSQITTLFIQIGSVPFLIAYWGVNQYGVWIALTAIPNYLMLCDFGFTYIAKNDMSMRVVRGDREGALVTYQSILALLVLMSFVVLLLAAILFHVLSFKNIFNIENVNSDVINVVLLSQVCSVVLYQFFLLFCAGIRCEGNAAAETTISTFFRLAEGVFVVIAAALGGGIEMAAYAILTVRICCLICVLFLLKKWAPWLLFGFRFVNLSRLREMAIPSISYMFVPIANSLLIQGPILLLGVFSNAFAITVFSVTRTVARLGMSGANMLNYAFCPEYSFAYGCQDSNRLGKLFKSHFVLLVAGIILYVLIMFFFGAEGVKIISHSKIDFNSYLCAVLTLGVLFEMLWSGIFAPLSAVNGHKESSVMLFILSGLFFLVGILNDGLMGIAFGLVVVHVVMLFVVVVMFKLTFKSYKIWNF